MIKMQVEQIVRRTFVKIIPPWTRYRLILTKIAKYLNVNKGVWDAFRVFFYQSISTSSREVEVSAWLKKMEQETIVSIDNLDVLIMFFEHNDEWMDIEILRSLREFKLWMETVHFLLLGLPEDQWLFSPPITRTTHESESKLLELFNSWSQRISLQRTCLTWSKIANVYSWATQRMNEVATSSANNARLLAHEAISIADFLMKEFAVWFLGRSDDELEGKFSEFEELNKF